MTKDRFILHKEHIIGFLRKLHKEYELIAPVKNVYGDTMFEVIPSMEGLNLELYQQTIMPPKNFFFPQIDTLFTYCRDGSTYKFREVFDESPRVIFGMRSCDIRAVLFFDVVFQENFKDTYYLKRRKNTIMIGLGCNQPGKNCFCKSAKSGPFLTHGYDLQLTDLGDRFFVEIGRPKGEDLVKKWAYFFSPATPQDSEEQYETVLESESKFNYILDFDTTVNRLLNEEVDEKIWEELGDRCQNCGGCTYICPTCYCFNMVDKPTSENEGQRIRAWDACTLAGFTRLADGYNPYQERRDRIKRRFYHKLYYDKKRYNIPSCVGCGRCVDICFGHVDMISFIRLVCKGS